jgi:hypothetical protein
MTRRPPQIGDVFSVRRAVGESLLGRVVSTSAIVGPTHGCLLAYVYRPGSSPSRESLLLPPILTTRAPWSHGQFEWVRHEPLLPADFFERHCFRDALGHLYDEEGRPLATAIEPVGEWKLWQVDTIDAAIARALRLG